MKNQRKRTQRGLYYRALAEGYRNLNPIVAGSFQLAVDHYDPTDPTLDPRGGRARRTEGLTKYYVYQDVRGRYRVRIHASDCSYCNEGRGVIFGDARVKGKWHGPFGYDEALQIAKDLAVSDTRLCLRCIAARHLLMK